MGEMQEKRAVDQVYGWLTAGFPDVALATVRLAVEQAHRLFDGCPVRRYVPVLVERAARETLARAPALELPTIPFQVHHHLTDSNELWQKVTSRVSTPPSRSVSSR